MKEIRAKGLQIDVSKGTRKTVLGLVGDTSVIDMEHVQGYDYVDKVLRVEEPYKRASRAFHPQNSIIRAGGVEIGGKKLAVRQGIVLEGAISIDHTWDYFSEKDGQVDHFDLCEECYDQLTATFKIPVETEEQTEYL